jgi:hypothetical protein
MQPACVVPEQLLSERAVHETPAQGVCVEISTPEVLAPPLGDEQVFHIPQMRNESPIRDLVHEFLDHFIWDAV